MGFLSDIASGLSDFASVAASAAKDAGSVAEEGASAASSNLGNLSDNLVTKHEPSSLYSQESPESFEVSPEKPLPESSLSATPDVSEVPEAFGANALSHPNSSGLLSSEAFKTELRQAVNDRIDNRFGGPEARNLAAEWGIDDVASVAALRKGRDLSGVNLDDVAFVRAVDREFLTDERLVFNNPKAAARVLDHGTLQINRHLITGDPALGPTSRQAREADAPFKSGERMTNLANGGINVGVSEHGGLSNVYGDESKVNIKINARDVFEFGGKVHGDLSSSWEPARMIELPNGVGVPYTIIE